MDTAINNGIMKAPKQVFYEIKKRDDALFKWLRNNKNKFIMGMDKNIIETASNIVTKFQNL